MLNRGCQERDIGTLIAKTWQEIVIVKPSTESTTKYWLCSNKRAIIYDNNNKNQNQKQYQERLQYHTVTLRSVCIHQ